jgi:hypothetical protein
MTNSEVEIRMRKQIREKIAKTVKGKGQNHKDVLDLKAQLAEWDLSARNR